MQRVGALSAGPHPAQGALSLINVLSIFDPLQKRLMCELIRAPTGTLRDLGETIRQISWKNNDHRKPCRP
jgi:hypothetical protein